MVNLLNKDPDVHISLDLLKQLDPEVRSRLLNSNLINNISEIHTAYKMPNSSMKQTRSEVEGQELCFDKEEAEGIMEESLLQGQPDLPMKQSQMTQQEVEELRESIVLQVKKI